LRAGPLLTWGSLESHASLNNSSGLANFAGFSLRGAYSALALYAEKEQSIDSDGTDVWE
jgi:hypothetical protein